MRRAGVAVRKAVVPLATAVSPVAAGARPPAPGVTPLAAAVTAAATGLSPLATAVTAAETGPAPIPRGKARSRRRTLRSGRRSMPPRAGQWRSRVGWSPLGVAFTFDASSRVLYRSSPGA